MLYLFIKYIHVLSATILFGTGIGTASTMLLAHRTQDINIIAAATRYVVIADWAFTTTSGILQMLTGLYLIYLAGYSFYFFWVWTSIVGYIIAGACWVPVVYMQIKMRDDAKWAQENAQALPARYYRYFNYWFYLGWPAFISLLIVFYLMISKPN